MKKLILFFFPRIYSPKGQMDLRDAVLGIGRAGLLSAMSAAIESLNAGSFVFNLKTIGASFLVGVLTYIVYSIKSGTKEN